MKEVQYVRNEIFQETKFLIVDDEPANVAVLENMLEQWNCLEVRTTTDSRQVEQIYIEYQPDIILLDLMMPYFDGFDVMERLKLLIPPGDYLPILVLTADPSAQIKRKALACGAKDFLTKPFDAMELFLRMMNLLETRYLHVELLSQNQRLEKRVQERTQELAQAEIETVSCMALAAEYRDDDTGRHTQRVGLTASLVARQMGQDEAQVDLIWRAGPLHDVGKIGIADQILRKPGSLTSEEFAVMKTHSKIGSEILSGHHTPLLQLASRIALTHHERWSGGGYPQGLEGEAIPLEGRIVAVADVFDALTHERPYKKAWPVEEAVAEIASQSGRQFDPAVVEAFLQVQAGCTLEAGLLAL
jgi:putative two-component system response regulator